MITSRTRLCAVLGFPVRHSASPAMQNAGLDALGLPWRYVACEVPPEQLRAAIVGARTLGFIGLNLTVPHKLLAVEMMDALDDSAARWGAVNTVRFEGQTSLGNWVPVGQAEGELTGPIRSVGFNTDADAIVASIQEDLGVRVAGARVLVLGAGGAGRVAAMRLAAEGPAALHLVNRTESKARQVALEIRRERPDLEVGVGYPSSGSLDLVLNATSLGMREDDPLPLEAAGIPFERIGAVYDMVYRPAETRLLGMGRAAGCRVANGLGMLLRQGTRALEIWSGRAAPVDAMRRALLENVYGAPCN